MIFPRLRDPQPRVHATEEIRFAGHGYAPRKQGLDLMEPAADIGVGHFRFYYMMKYDSLLRK